MENTYVATKADKKNRWAFGLGTIGRDMVYTLISMYLLFYMTDVLELTTNTLWWISGIMLAVRVFDAVNDPFMGLLVDNTNTRFGKFKPWIAFGALTSGIMTIFMFTQFAVSETMFIILFAVFYVLWEIFFTTNDIAYWSMLPSLSVNQKEREKIGSIARICANIGLFIIVAGIVPLTELLGAGNLPRGYTTFTIILVAIMWVGQCITLFFVKEPKLTKPQPQTSIKELVTVIFKNDQLLCTAIAMALFMTGYMTTTSFGLYFFKYAYGDEGMYSIFAVILGVSQIAALGVFPLFSKKLKRKSIYGVAMVLVFIGYIIFFFSPNTNMTFIGIAGVLIFVGEAFMQLLMLMYLADSVDYGHWKLKKRNDSITLSLQPFINKAGGAIANGVVSVVIIVSGIKDANSAADVTGDGLLLMKIAMLLFPLICILGSYFMHRAKYKIDEKMHASILSDLKERGELDMTDGELSFVTGE